MFRPWNITVPSTRASGMVSCIRLRQRSSVDLPHPDGPMIAVTSLAGNDSETSRTACVEPKYAFNARVSIAGAVVSCAAGAEATRATASVIRAAVARAHGEPGQDADHEHERDQHERPRPCLRVPLVVRADRVDELLQRERGDRL